MVRGVVGNKGIGAKGGHEAFQTGEVCAPRRKHQARMEKLAIKLLSFIHIVSLTGKPFFDGSFVLGFLMLRDSHSVF